jgi:undecaprenyl diphosphate synthase
MDGNGRWARARGMPRQAGHRAGVKSARSIVETCGRLGIPILTLFTFSSENWKRPEGEVAGLMRLFLQAIGKEARELHENNVRLRFIGDRTTLSGALQAQLRDAEALTSGNTGMLLNIAMSYGGRWDIVHAVGGVLRDVAEGRLRADEVNEEKFAAYLSLAGQPDPDLFIRTGGEMRVSNFLLWNLAYTEMVFSDALWPDFSERDLEAALSSFANRQRRFGGVPDVAGAI